MAAPKKRPQVKASASEEVIARELRKALRRDTRLATLIAEVEAEHERLRNERDATKTMISQFRKALDGSKAFDADGKPVK